MFREEVKFENTEWNIKSESIFLLLYWLWYTEARGSTSIRYRISSSSKRWLLIIKPIGFSYLANAINSPPDKYGRKTKN